MLAVRPYVLVLETIGVSRGSVSVAGIHVPTEGAPYINALANDHRDAGAPT